MKRTPIKVKEALKFLKPFGITIEKKDLCELIIYETTSFLCINKQPYCFFFQDTCLPTLKLLQQHQQLLPFVLVDKGAIPFIIKGADIMRPGITSIPNVFEKDSFIVIMDEINHKPLAIGKAILSSIDIKTALSGKVIKNIHYIGDSIWKFEI